ncbi:MAG: TetR/AcrR family transcriptional regulator [Dehalococcoidia bacterium]|jgi:AcrR family transcriptional regulator
MNIKEVNKQKRTKSANAKLQRIARIASALFFEKGFTETSVRDISKACNISMGHLYYYIKSKDDFPVIFGEIHLKNVSEWESKVRREMLKSPPEITLRYAVRNYLHLIHARRKMMLFWYRVAKSLKPEQLQGVIESEVRVVNVFKQILETGAQHGQFDVSDPFLTAFQIEVLCHTWVLKRWFLHDLYTIDQFIDICENNAVSMVRGPSK